jgi:hypothetical protein
MVYQGHGIGHDRTAFRAMAARMAAASAVSPCSVSALKLFLVLLMMFLRMDLPFAVVGLRIFDLSAESSETID